MQHLWKFFCFEANYSIGPSNFHRKKEHRKKIISRYSMTCRTRCHHTMITARWTLNTNTWIFQMHKTTAPFRCVNKAISQDLQHFIKSTTQQSPPVHHKWTVSTTMLPNLTKCTTKLLLYYLHTSADGTLQSNITKKQIPYPKEPTILYFDLFFSSKRKKRENEDVNVSKCKYVYFPHSNSKLTRIAITIKSDRNC